MTEKATNVGSAVPGDGHIQYAVEKSDVSPPSVTASNTTTQQPCTPTRLYIGNLPPTLTEYHLLKLFSPLGTLTKIDFLWHKQGPHKGEPRGYCFIEYADKADAKRAVEKMHGKVVAGRTLVVSFSVEFEGEQGGAAAAVGGSANSGPSVATSVATGIPTASRRGKGRGRGRTDPRYREPPREPVNQKLQAKVVHVSTDSKISAIERKMQQLQQAKDKGGEECGSAGSSTRSSPWQHRDRRTDHSRSHPYRR
ncbi:uncharacterized protein EV422DRAFT_564857 [Fimicolochytrium jonesii]|uniref:uncharacterized protein n=1 Tax=Fimicolochytrium jonesii TaxID=1396493 RepID=UPI0022FE5CCF|nr:uncharacterized protein EV422DRAFT_564857 [Fimicolochytrium jonesii]KAI8824147.1 hypothetical protein EV422DRAFT_564857 [Fimicolochytrium jonesii]